MWLFPVLSILTTLAMVAILVQMALDADLRSQLLSEPLSWAVVLGLFFLNKRFNTSHHIEVDAAEAKARALIETSDDEGTAQLMRISFLLTNSSMP